MRVERDGISAQHDARFLLVGTMNPEEGALRPQLLDRFGLSVTITAPQDREDRAEIVSRRMAFEQYPAIFVERFARTETALQGILEQARQIVGEVTLPAHQLAVISDICMALEVEGMRADIVIARTATALAALDRRDEVIDRDIETAARLALPHRARTSIAGEEWISSSRINEAIARATGEGDDSDSGSAPTRAVSPPRTDAARRTSAAVDGPNLMAKSTRKPSSGPLGRSQRATGGDRPAIDATPTSDADDLDVIATARAAVTRRLIGRGDDTIAAADLHAQVRSGRGGEFGALRR